MKFKIIFFIYLIVSLTSPAFGEIKMINDLVELKLAIEKSDSDTLVIFDVDHVLIMPTDEYTINRNPYRKKLWNELTKTLSKEKVRELYGITASMSKWQLVDNEMIEIISKIRKRKIPAIALTALSTGKFGVIEKLEDWRIKQLQDFKINFIDLTPIHDHIEIESMERDNGIPMIKSGILFSAENSKGKVLEHILQEQNYLPSTIIFIDDQLKNIKDIESMSNRLGIKYLGLHYTFVEKRQNPIINKKIENIRFSILIKDHLWLGYNEALSRK